MTEGWKVEREDGAAVLSLGTGKANAMNESFLDALEAGLEEAAALEPCGLVLTGEGSAFSAGLDLPALQGLGRDEMVAFMARFRDALLKVLEFPARTIAAINGHAVAGGAVLACACDHRLAALGRYWIGVRETALGVGLPRSAMEILRRALPKERLEEVVLFGRLYTPEDALEVDLIHELVRPERLRPAALRRAIRDADVPRAALAQVRRGLVAPWADLIRRAGDDHDWVDTWFSEEAQRRIEKTIRKLEEKQG